MQLSNTKSKQTNRKKFKNKNNIEIAIFKFTNLIRFRIMGQLKAFFSHLMRLETEVLSLYGLSCWCDGNREHRNHRHATFMSIGTCRVILKSFLCNTYDNAIFIIVNEIKSNNFLAGILATSSAR